MPRLTKSSHKTLKVAPSFKVAWLSLLLTLVASVFLVGGANVARGEVSFGCDPYAYGGSGPSQCLLFANYGYAGYWGNASQTKCLPLLIKNSEPIGYAGYFCQMLPGGLDNQWQMTRYPTVDQAHPTQGVNNPKWTAGTLSTPACNAVGQYSPNPDSPSAWQSSPLSSQTFTFQFNNPASPVSTDGWRCSPVTGCSCTATSNWIYGAYNQTCWTNRGDKVVIYEQTCTHGPGANKAPLPPAPNPNTYANSWQVCDQSATKHKYNMSGNQNKPCEPGAKEINGDCVWDRGLYGCYDPNYTSNVGGPPPAWQPPNDSRWHWEWDYCTKTAQGDIACGTPRGMVEDDKPWCTLSYSPGIGQWTNGCVTATASGRDVAPPDRHSGLAGGASGGGTRCTNGDTPSGSVRDNAGNVGTCPPGYVSWIDKTLPTMTTLSVPPFAADNPWTPPAINFVDTCGTTGEGPCAGTSGVGVITATITSPTGRTITRTGTGGGLANYAWTFSGDFSEAGPYQLDLEVCDMAVNGGNTGNCQTYNKPNFFHVVANVPEWNTCLQNYHSVCPSTISYGAMSAKNATSYTAGNNAAGSVTVVADNTTGEYHAVEVQLSDRYGNPVVSETGIKAVQTQYDYTNTVYADQIAQTGDAIHYSTIFSGANGDYPASNTVALRTQVGPLVGANSSYPYSAPKNGKYTVQTRSHAPTASGYAPLQQPPHGGWQVMLQDMIYTVSGTGYSGVGEIGATTVDTSATAAAPAPDLKFAPTLVVTPEAMNPNGAGGYIASAAARQNVTINEEKRFQLAFTNNSVSGGTAALHEVGLVLDATDPNVTWKDAVLETITTNGVENPTPAASDLILTIDTTQSSFTPGWNGLSNIASVVANATNNPLARFRATPVLAYQTTAPSTATEFRAYAGYTIGGVHVRHKSERIGTDTNPCGNGVIDPTETCTSCPQDYVSNSIACCGNGIVENSTTVGYGGEQCELPGTTTCDWTCRNSDTTSSTSTSGSTGGSGGSGTSSSSTSSGSGGSGTSSGGSGGSGTSSGGGTTEICTDGIDNDLNGLIDCADSNCSSTPVCNGSLCGNGVVNLNENCNTCPQDIAVCGLVQNATVDIAGLIRTSDGTVTNNPYNELNQDVGDVSSGELQSSLNRAVAAFTANASAARCSSSTQYTINGVTGNVFTGLAGSATTNFASCSSQNDAVVFFDFTNGGDVNLGTVGTTLTLPTGPRTILIRGGNLHIRSNLVYPSGTDNTLGIIVLPSDTGKDGNVYIYPEVTNMVGALYTEGGMITVNSAGIPDEYVNWDNSSQCAANGSNGICDRSTDLRNQLYWRGLLISQNTIGGSDQNPPVCPKGQQSVCDALFNIDLLRVQALPATHSERVVYDSDPARWTEKRKAAIARRYDFLYVRKFTVSAGGLRATNPAPPNSNTNNNSLIIEYDSQINSNPPPLFELLGGSSSSELGQ